MEPHKDTQAVRLESNIETQQVIEKLLSPKIEEDNAGFQRKIYTYEGITFSFRGREELPIYPTFEEANTIVLGESPRFIPDDEYQGYLEAQGQNSEAPKHFAVTKTALGVVDLALAIGSKDITLRKVKEDLEQKNYTQDVLKLIDQLVAANFVRNESIENLPDIDGEALILLSLLGDEDAKSLVRQKLQILQETDTNKEKLTLTEEDEKYLSPIDESELVSVHATNFRPEVDKDGNFLIKTTFDAIDGKTVRNSVHFSLNHKVVSHDFGSWDESKFVLLSPFKDMLDKNGLPERLMEVDTWWVRNPGERMVLPNPVLIALGNDVNNSLIHSEGNEVKVKSEGFTLEDLKQVYEWRKAAGDEPSFLYNLSYGQQAFLARVDKLTKNDQYSGSEVYIKALYTALRSKFAEKFEWTEMQSQFRDLFDTSSYEDTTIESWGERIITSLDIDSSGIDPETQIKITHDVNALLGDVLRKWLSSQLMEYTVKKTITDKGFKAAWSNGKETNLKGVKELGRKQGVWGGDHQQSKQFIIEKKLINAVNAAHSEDGFLWENFDSDHVKSGSLYSGDPPDLMEDIHNKTRRSVYATGLLNSRVPQEKGEDDFFVFDERQEDTSRYSWIDDVLGDEEDAAK